MGEATPTRPRSLQELAERRVETGFRELMDDSEARGLAFRPRPTDLFISPYAKCGTTWLQQIVHGLRTGGDMDFDDISRVVPWLETAHALGLDLEAPQPGPFRAFKSHLSRHDIPEGGRYLVSLRDPKDALVSLYHFFDGWLFEAGSVDIAEFARTLYLGDRSQGGYWRHLTSWWPRRRDDGVLLLCYEDMKRDPAGAVERIASFLDLPLDDDLLELVVRQSSLEFMLAHRDRFDDLLMRELLVRERQTPPGGDAAKVRRGRVGDHRRELPADVAAELDAVWKEDVEAVTGLDSYRAVRDALARGTRRPAG